MSPELKAAMEKLAEEYCDQPRCAQVTRDDKSWHRMKAAHIAGFTAAVPLAQAEEKSRSAKLLAALKNIARDFGTDHADGNTMIAKEAIDEYGAGK